MHLAVGIDRGALHPHPFDPVLAEYFNRRGKETEMDPFGLAIGADVEERAHGLDILFAQP